MENQNETISIGKRKKRKKNKKKHKRGVLEEHSSLKSVKIFHDVNTNRNKEKIQSDDAEPNHENNFFNSSMLNKVKSKNKKKKFILIDGEEKNTMTSDTTKYDYHEDIQRDRNENVCDNDAKYKKKRKRKAEEIFCQDENKLETDVICVSKRKKFKFSSQKKKKKTHSEKFGVQEQYVREKHKNNNIDAIDDKKIEENISEINMVNLNKTEVSTSTINSLIEQTINIKDSIDYTNLIKRKKKKLKNRHDNKADVYTEGEGELQNDGKDAASESPCTFDDSYKESNNVKNDFDELTESKPKNKNHINRNIKLEDRKQQIIHWDTIEHDSVHKKCRKLSNFATKPKMKTATFQEVDTLLLQDHSLEVDIESMSINIPFPVHPLHMYCSRSSRPKPEEIAAAQEANLKIKSGSFTQAEDDIIRDNWRAFCKEHNLNLEPCNFFKFPPKMKMEQRVKFLQYLGHGLEDRLLHRVHYRFKRVFQNPLIKHGRFTEEEDNQIIKYVTYTESTTPFKDLAQMLNRSNLSIEKRCDILCSSVKTKIKWTIEIIDKLVNHMLKIKKSKEIADLRDATFTSEQWQKLSIKMEGIPIKRLQRVWKIYIYPRFFSNDDVDLVNMKKKIIKILYKQKESDWRSVNWEEIAAKFEGFTPQKIYMMFKQTIMFHVPEQISKNLKDCVEYMNNIFLKQSHLKTAHKFDRFIYEDGHVQYKRNI